MTRNPAAIALLAVVAACGTATEPPVDPNAWVGEITEVDGRTRVVNTSGSVWGGTATLVEEASIGVIEGDDEYMLGRINSVWATDGEIVVLDGQAVAVRVYDYDGSYLRTLGGRGQGPGEYENPGYVTGDTDGRVYVGDFAARRIQIFSVDGEDLGSWPMGNVFCCLFPMVAAHDGTVYVQASAWHERTGFPVDALLAHGPDGAFGDPLMPPEYDGPHHEFDFQDRVSPTMYAPKAVWALAADGARAGGSSHEYTFEITKPDGTRIDVERGYEPFPLVGEERDWYRRYTMAIYRRGEPGWTWDAAEMPAVKPAYERFIPTQDGRWWVVRPGPARQLPQCDPDADVDDHGAFQAASCYRDWELVDVFDADGRYLGDVEVPHEINLRFAFPWVKGETVIASRIDEDGLIRVVRYRLHLPADN